jgi:hypothetical protein
MPLRRTALAAFVLTLAFAVPAVGSAAVYTDPAGDDDGDQAPDIQTITVTNSASAVSFLVHMPNRSGGFRDADTFTLYLDVNGAGSGDPTKFGADYYVRVADTTTLVPWTGYGWGLGGPSSAVSSFIAAPDVAVGVGLGAVGNPASVRFSVTATWEGIVDYSDTAPDSGSYSYPVHTSPPPADKTAPLTRITRGPSGPTSSHKATFRFASSEKGSTFYCRLDARRWRLCSSPKVYRGLIKGRHVFRVYARDKAGNADTTPAVRRWRIR